MAGAISVIPYDPIVVGASRSWEITATLTLDASGNLNGETIELPPGYLTDVITNPDGDDPPTEGYTLKLISPHGDDVLIGGGSGRSATLSQRLTGKPAFVVGELEPQIASGGADAVITLTLCLMSA